MNAVHVRGYNQPAQRGIEAFGNADVAMVEHGGGVEQQFEHQNSRRGRSKCYNHCELDDHGQQDLDWVETQTGAHIDVEISMVHSVQAPERWHGMKEHMLKVDCEIQEYDRGHDTDPGRDW